MSTCTHVYMHTRVHVCTLVHAHTQVRQLVTCAFHFLGCHWAEVPSTIDEPLRWQPSAISDMTWVLGTWSWAPAPAASQNLLTCRFSGPDGPEAWVGPGLWFCA